jgi:hypothetical protein
MIQELDTFKSDVCSQRSGQDSKISVVKPQATGFWTGLFLGHLFICAEASFPFLQWLLKSKSIATKLCRAVPTSVGAY